MDVLAHIFWLSCFFLSEMSFPSYQPFRALHIFKSWADFLFFLEDFVKLDI